MKTFLLTRIIVVAAAILLAACAGRRTVQGVFDLGPLPSASATAGAALPPVSLADLEAPAWLATQAMHYRLGYANAQQLQRYASSRWTMAPPALLAQRLKSRIAQAGGVVLSAQDGAAQVPVLRLDLDDFTQVFTTPDQSHAQIALRASLFNGRALVAQKNFAHTMPAPSADAEGGAAAMAAASDAVIADIIAWLAQTRTAK
jgi:cholesterol transport system auxiliary component